MSARCSARFVRPIDVEIHLHALHAVALARSHGFSFYDALIVASALEASCDTLLTEGLQAGRRVDGLSIVNPVRLKRRLHRQRSRATAPTRAPVSQFIAFRQPRNGKWHWSFLDKA